MNLAMLVHAVARRLPSAPAVSCEDTTWSYAELVDRAARTASFIRSSTGAVAGDRVGLVLENCAGFLQLLLGCWHAGVCPVPIDTRLHPRELALLLEHSGARSCFASPDLCQGLIAHAGPSAPFGILEADPGLIEEMANASTMPPVDRNADDPAWIFYTRGTTGRPKGATLTQRGLMFMAHAYYADVDALDERDTLLHLTPMSQASGLLALPHLARGSHNVILGAGAAAPETVFEAIERRTQVSFYCTPTTLAGMLADGGAEDAPLTNLKCIVYGGAPMRVDTLLRALEVFGPRLHQVYGQGECPLTIAGLDRRAHALAFERGDVDTLASAGYPRTGVEVRVAGEDERTPAAGAIGEILTRSDCVMRGYWNDPVASAAALRGGWLHTGDLGSIDARGCLTLRDRCSDLIVSDGTHVHPRDVEDALMTHPGVREACAVGAPHAGSGEEVVAFVVAAPGAAPTVDALDAACTDAIARFKRPRRYVFVDALPRSADGTVLRRALRERLRGNAS